MSIKNRYFFVVFMLVLIGITMVYSSSHIWAEYKFHDALYYLKRQCFFVVIGLFLMVVFSKIDYHLYEEYRYTILIISFILLGLVLIPGIGSVRGGSRSWFTFGGLSLQPSEFFKIAIIIKTASFLSTHVIESKRLKVVLKELTFLGAGFLLIMMQPDFGTGFVMVCGIMIMIMVSHFLLNIFCG